MSHSQAFCKTARLLTSHDFKQVFNHVSFRLSSANLVVLVRSRASGNARLGLIVARKNARRAIDRNRIKRVVRESFRKTQQQLGACDYVVMTRKGITGVDNPALHNEAEQLWQDARKRITLLAAEARG